MTETSFIHQCYGIHGYCLAFGHFRQQQTAHVAAILLSRPQLLPFCQAWDAQLEISGLSSFNPKEHAELYPATYAALRGLINGNNYSAAFCLSTEIPTPIATAAAFANLSIDIANLANQWISSNDPGQDNLAYCFEAGIPGHDEIHYFFTNNVRCPTLRIHSWCIPETDNRNPPLQAANLLAWNMANIGFTR